MIDVLILHADPAFADGVRASGLPVRVHPAADMAAALAQCTEAEVLVALAHDVSQELIDAMPRLQLMQALTTGVDVLEQRVLPAGTIVANTRGVHGPQISELAFLMMLSLLRDFPRMLENQRAARWQRWPQKLLHGRAVVIVGVGAIGEALAARCQAFGMRVVGVSGGRGDAPGFDAVVPRSGLIEAAAAADVVIVLAPYSTANHHLVDAATIGAMRRDAVLINLARGNVVDEAALAHALAAGRLAGAGLDVFAQEPLPEDSPLWHMNNVIVTPHIGGLSDIYAQQVLPVVIGNLAAFTGGRREAMRNLCWVQGEPQ